MCNRDRDSRPPGRRPGPAEENDAGFGRWAPVTVIAGDQDLIALWVDVFHPKPVSYSHPRPHDPTLHTDFGLRLEKKKKKRDNKTDATHV